MMGEWLNAVTFSRLILSSDFICVCKVQSEASHCNISNTTGSGSIVSPSVWLTAEVEEQRSNRAERRRNTKHCNLLFVSPLAEIEVVLQKRVHFTRMGRSETGLTNK